MLRPYDSKKSSVPAWEACKAFSSAPVYFPAHLLKFGESHIPLVDGGVVANNPSACALAEAIRLQNAASLYESSEILMAAFGTGSLTRPITPEEATVED